MLNDKDQTMQSMIIEQLRAAGNAGGVSGVTLKGQGGAFLVQIATRNCSVAVLSKASSTEPRRFGNLLPAAGRVSCAGSTKRRRTISGWPGLPDWLRELVAHPNHIVFHRVLAETRTVEILGLKHAAQQEPPVETMS